jgi:malate dehydrogenase
MSFIAILGAGALGGTLAHRLASRGRIREVRLIDEHAAVAQGKALDIQQSGAVEGFAVRVTSAGGIEAAAGADAIVIADSSAGDQEHTGEAGLAMLRRIAAIDTAAPLVFAGAHQRLLLARTATELHVEPRRLIGSAPGALESAVRALAALEADGSGVEVQLRVVGVPPDAAVVAWEESTAFGQPLTAVLPPHRIAAIAARLPRLWPPGPIVLASAAARVAEAVAGGSRRRYSCFVALLEGSITRVLAMPVELGRGGVVRVLRPALTRQEQTRLDNAASQQSEIS